MRNFQLISFVFFCILTIFFSSSVAFGKEDRIALVIGNGAYKNSPLRNPVNDANDIAAALKKFNFHVIRVINANRKKMLQQIRSFGYKLKNYDVGLFYYAGHGVQVDGENYLVPIGADVRAEDEVRDECLLVSSVLRKMDTAGNSLNIIILDACRDNPFARSYRSSNQGLAKMDAPTGSIMAYATAPGSVAADGSGRNGLYTAKLLEHMATPGLEIGLLFRKVRVEVLNATSKRQVPWESSSLTGQFYLMPKRGIGVVAKTIESVPSKKKKIEIAGISKNDYRPVVNLRSSIKSELDKHSVSRMVMKFGFYDSKINPTHSFKNHFINNNDGTYTDMATGLMWQKAGSQRRLTESSANRYITKLNKESFAGYSDWRIPTLEEIASILYNANTNVDMHINPIFSLKQNRCWSSDDLKPGESRGLYESWIVDFKSGNIKLSLHLGRDKHSYLNDYIQNELNYVKAVRTVHN